MARDHARILVAIWSDPDFRDLPANGQHMFFTLLSQPRLTYVGALDYLPNRLAKLTKKATPRTVANAVGILEDARFVHTDDETGELLIRSFVRHDGLLSSPNVTKAMAKDYEALLSEPLRRVVDEELRRAFTDGSDLKGWQGLEEGFPDLFAKVCRKGSGKGSANG